MSSHFPMAYFDVERFVFARLDEEAAGGSPQERIEPLRLLAAAHSIWVDRERVSHWRCFTCDLTEGAPCSTISRLAYMWWPHPDFPEWAKGNAGAGLMRIGGDAADAGGWFALRYPEVVKAEERA